MFYGERDYWPDGSFMTTEWFVVAWVPIIPICSKRIAYARNSDYAVYDSSQQFYVYETLGVDRRQALSVYAWFASVFAPIVVFGAFQDTLVKKFRDEDLVAGLCLMLTAVAFVSPYFLRGWSKRRKVAQWKRQNLGLRE